MKISDFLSHVPYKPYKHYEPYKPNLFSSA